MTSFTNHEWANIVLCYGAAGQNARQARVLYQQRFRNARIPTERTFVSALQHLRDHGQFQPMTVDRGRTRTRRTLNAETRILDAVEKDSETSIRKLSAKTGVSEFIVWRTLNQNQNSLVKDKFRSTTRPSDTESPLPTNTILFPETAEGSQPSTSSSGSPSTDPFKEEASCSREDASALEWLPEQTNPPDLRPKPFKGNKDKIYCRLCLKPANKNSLTPLSVVDFNYPGKSDSFKNKKLEKVEEINKMLKHCLPFYDSLTFNPIICSICFGRLKIAYEFSQECLKSQRLIEKYAETYGTTEKVINLNEMVETQFELLNHENLSETETKATDIPKVTRSSTRISRKRQYPNEDGPSTKKQKEYPESHDEDSLASSNEDASNIKIEPDDDDSCALTESVKTEPDEDDSNAFTENITHGVSLINPNKIDVDHSVIKVEPTYIDCPDFVKNESVDDLHIENKVFSERTVVKTDIEGEQSQFLGEGNVSPGVTGAPSFDRGSVFPSIGSSLEDTTSDVIK